MLITSGPRCYGATNTQTREGYVAPISVTRVLAAIALSSVLAATALEAQLVPTQEPHRFELTGFAGAIREFVNNAIPWATEQLDAL